MSPTQGDAYATDVEEDDADVRHKNDSLPNDVAGTLEVFVVNDNSSDVMTNRSRTKNMQPPKKRKKTSEQVSWKKKTNLKEIPEADVIHLDESHPHLAMLERSEFFRLLFNDEICSLIVTETERYASQRNKTIQLMRQEIEVFVGILLLTGYNSRPHQRLYWRKDDDVCSPLVLKSKSRKRFEEIKKYIHFANNNNLSAGDELAKIRPLQDKVNVSLQQFGVFTRDLSTDEQMVPYFGRHSAKMFIRGKPIRFGYKNWVLISSDGYPYKSESYTGACATKDSSKPLGPQVVSALISVVANPACHRLYFDNFLRHIVYSEIYMKMILELLGPYKRFAQ